MAEIKCVTDDLERRWADKFEEAPETNCWIWTAAKDPLGYGRIGPGRGARGMKLAHRVGYELFVAPPPPGLDLHHICETPSCVNPGHLEPLTRKEHVRLSKPTHCPQGHPYDEANTYVRASGGRQCRACHREQELRRKRRLRDGA